MRTLPRNRTCYCAEAIRALALSLRERSKSIMRPWLAMQSERAVNPAPSETNLRPEGVSQPPGEAIANVEATGPDLFSGRMNTNTRVPEAVVDVMGSTEMA